MREHIVNYMNEKGIFKLRRTDLQMSIAPRLVDSRVPSLNEIGHSLKHDFSLRYRREDGANVKYRDPAIDGRRIWASRLLAHFVAEDFLVISIDETHIRSDKAQGYGWQFVANDRPFMNMLLDPRGTHEHEEVAEEEGSQVGEISSEISELSVKSFKSTL